MAVWAVREAPRRVARFAAADATLWAMIFIAGLLAAGFGRPRSAANTPRMRDGQPIARQPVRENDRRPARGDGRGRSATTPSEIPARGWKDVLVRAYRNIGEDRVMLVAAGVTFYSLLAIFPAIAALVALYGFFADPSHIADQVGQLSGVLPGGALDVIRDQLHRVATQGSSKLGITFIIGLAVSLWSANAAMKSIFDALNLVYDEPEKRGFIKLNLVSLAFTVAGIVFVLLAIGCIVALPAVFSSAGSSGATALIGKIARWPILFLVIGVALAFIYRYGPSRAEPQWRWITWGGAFAAVGWIVVSILFSLYTTNFADYDKTYGSLGAIIGFMVWIWLSTTVILAGAEINAESEHQTARDTTTGAPKPLGARGAKMADTVGAATTTG